MVGLYHFEVVCILCSFYMFVGGLSLLVVILCFFLIGQHPLVVVEILELFVGIYLLVAILLLFVVVLDF